MSVHGRRDDGPRGLGADYAATAAGVLAVQGLLAAGRVLVADDQESQAAHRRVVQPEQPAYLVAAAFCHPDPVLAPSHAVHSSIDEEDPVWVARADDAFLYWSFATRRRDE